jgi:hypothetical protein
MDNQMINKILRYTAQAAAVYLVFRFVPTTPLDNMTIILITAIVMAVYFVLENLCNFSMSQSDKLAMCSSVCSLNQPASQVQQEVKKETMETVSPPTQPVQTAQVSELEKKLEELQKKLTENSTQVASNTPNTVDENASDNESQDESNIIDNEMKYSDYNHVPMGNLEYEYGYSFMPPANWYPQPPNPPVCVAEKKCAVCPVYTQGAPVDVKEWNQSRRITPPDRINLKYVREKLNSGQ